jgi:hypothetical protein
VAAVADAPGAIDASGADPEPCVASAGTCAPSAVAGGGASGVAGGTTAWQAGTSQNGANQRTRRDGSRKLARLA